MKILISILLSTCSLGSLVEAKTVSEYFERIPSQTFTEGSPKQLSQLARKGHGLIDEKNGYLRFDGDGAQVSLQVALFRNTDKSPMLIVAWGELEEPDFTHLTIFLEANGKMVVADRKIFPVSNSEKIRFELPRHGRTVIVRDATDKVVSKWTWNGTAFSKNP